MDMHTSGNYNYMLGGKIKNVVLDQAISAISLQEHQKNIQYNKNNKTSCPCFSSIVSDDDNNFFDDDDVMIGLPSGCGASGGV